MRIAIIGAGVAGLSAARALSRQGLEPVLFDKSRGVGGRMSTRYAQAWEFDHGAQFFSVQDGDFRADIEAAVKAGAAAPWDAKALYLKAGALSVDTGRARYVGTPRMNSLPKYWAKGLDINLGRRVASVEKSGGEKSGAEKSGSWILTFEDGTIETGFDGVISTIPPAQAEKILPSNFPKIAEVKASKMHVCFCLMVGLSAPINLGWDTLRVKDLPIDWIAVNNMKPGRSQDVGTLVVHSEAAWSDVNADSDRDWIQDVMLKSASALLGLPLDEAPHIALHRWLYASNKTSPDAPCLTSDGLVVAGDWCLGGRGQGAWLSGRAAAQSFL